MRLMSPRQVALLLFIENMKVVVSSVGEMNATEGSPFRSLHPVTVASERPWLSKVLSLFAI